MDVEKIAADLFAFFGVDQASSNADVLLWLSLATCVFPALATTPEAPKKRGRPPNQSRKTSHYQIMLLTKKWLAFQQEERRRGRGLNEGNSYDAFIRQNKVLYRPFAKGADKDAQISIERFKKKINIGKKLLAIINPDDLDDEPQTLIEALNYAPQLHARKLQEELAMIDTGTTSGKERLVDIAVEVKEMVPPLIANGLVTIRPFWRRVKK